MSFVHLHLHTEYSILDSIVHIESLTQEVKNRLMPAVAITDVCNLFGMVKFYKAAIRQGIKPIIGSELWIEQEEKSNTGTCYHKIVLLCQNKEGYRNLTKLISLAYQEGERLQVPLARKAWVKECASGLIALSGIRGEVGQAIANGLEQKAKGLLNEWILIFPNRFYLEIERRQSRLPDKKYESTLFELAKDLSCPIVATNNVLFLNQSDFEAHQARVCIQEGTTLAQFTQERYSPEQYLKSPDEMLTLFQDIPEALANTIEIAKRCSLSLILDKFVLPSFPVPPNRTEETYLQEASFEGLRKRLVKKKKDYAIYHERLHRELTVINSMGFPGYFLIVADFIQWAKANGIPVGPGRGSGAGSLVAYALSITDLDPIAYDLLFERFLNPERVSMPDFDIDFCMDNRDRVIDYVTNRYGRNNVSQIATFGTMAAKAVIRDVGRVLGYPYGFVDKIAKLIPFEIGMTLEKALSQELTLQKRYQEEEEVKNLIDLAKKLEGSARNVGKHAGGVVIAPSALTDYAPFFCEKNSNQVVIQFDKDDVEAIGLIKFDFLGLKTLTIIDKALQNANFLLQKKGLSPIDIHSIPLDDPKTFALLKRCATTAVFQLESRGMKDLIKRLQPDQFEEIIALVALFRPGPLQSGMVDDFINRKHGRAKVEYPHPMIEPILKSTYGVILYQEQVMQVAQTLAGYTLGSADLLRRAMGKKKPEAMAKQRNAFVQGACGKGVNEETASYIFDLIEKFAGYGFNKSHSAAYALVSYQTAWLKAHFPSAFMAAVLSADLANTDKIFTFIEECRQNEIHVIPPNIQTSQYYFTVNENEEIVYGLGAVKGVGEVAILDIIEKRKTPFKDLYDFCQRIDHRKVNKRVIESLIKSGAFDGFNQERAYMMATLDGAMLRAEQISKNVSYGQISLFQAFEEENEIFLEAHNDIKWNVEERLQAEKESLGMYFSGHPLEIIEPFLEKIGVKKFKALSFSRKESKTLIAGLLVSLKAMRTKNGDRMAVLTLDDRFNRFEVTVFPDPYRIYRELLQKDQIIIVEGSVAEDIFTNGLRVKAQAIYTLSTMKEKCARKIVISLNEKGIPSTFTQQLEGCLKAQEKGSCPVFVEYQSIEAKTRIKLGSEFNCRPSEDLIQAINDLLALPLAKIEYE